MHLTTIELRRLDAAGLERLGRDSLRDHLMAQAVVAHRKHGPLCAANLELFLRDPECLRHPVRLVFEYGEMAMHQFAQADVDWRNPAVDGRVLYVRPALREAPESLPLAVAYHVPLINYGDIVSDALCLAYGAAVLGLTEDEYYDGLCAMCDALGAAARFATSVEGACSGMAMA